MTEARSLASWNWIISPAQDSLWFLASSAAAYVFLWLALGTSNPALVWLLWAMLIDTPHYFGTYSRTFLDPDMFKRERKRLLRSLAFPLLAPAVILLSAVLYSRSIPGFRLPIFAFTMAFNFWAFWHLVRQHYGIMRLYQRRNDDEAQIDRWLDFALIHGALFGSFFLLGLRHPESRVSLGLSPEPLRAWAGHWDQFATYAAWGLALIPCAAFAARQVQRAAQGETLNAPKILFLTGVVSSYLLVSTYTPGYVLPLLFWTGTITIAHNFQYQAIVWFFHRRRPPAENKSWSERIRSHLPLYIGAALLTGIVLRVAGTSLEVFPGLPALIHTKGVVLFGDVTVQELLFLAMLGVAMNHYYLDQILWRPSRDASLRTTLGVNG